MLATKLPQSQPAHGTGRIGNGGLAVGDFGSGGSNRSRYRTSAGENPDLTMYPADFLSGSDFGGLEGLPNFSSTGPTALQDSEHVTLGGGDLLAQEVEKARDLSEQDHALLKLRAIFADPDNPEDMAAIRVLQEHEERKAKSVSVAPGDDRSSGEDEPMNFALRAYLEF